MSFDHEKQAKSKKNNIDSLSKQEYREVKVKIPVYKGYQLSKSRIEWAIHNSISMSQAARTLGVAYNTFKKYAKQYDLWHPSESSHKKEHTQPYDWNKRANAILEGKHPNYPIQRLQWVLIREGKLQEVCYECTYQKKRPLDNKVPVMLDFIDKDTHNHDIENLRMLCYNCYFHFNRPLLKMSPQSRMQSSIEHFTEKFEEELNAVGDTASMAEEVNAEVTSTPAPPKHQDFSWGDIQLPDKF